MTLLIQYLLKFSISLGLVWLFYQFVLRKLTFYNSNRWFLLGYSFISFFIPFIDINTVIENSESTGQFVAVIPAVHQYTVALEAATHCPVPLWSTPFDKWDLMGLTIIGGGLFLLARFFIRCISFLRIRKKASLISDEGMKIYHLEENIIPFSFGNSIFINKHLHTPAELEEIIRHEFVHVRQRHTLDIVWSEFLCIINWYNPFAWLIRRSVRQNLEFIADNEVLKNGIDRRQYQYLLLKVIGNNQFSIAQKFNFSSLKKRIAMMNKLRSARLHLVKFLFILPLLAVILISFRKQINRDGEQELSSQQAIRDTIPNVSELNAKGYLIDIKDNKGECTVVVKDKNGKEVARLPLNTWKERKDYYENLYGEILAPPVPPVPPVPPAVAVLPKNVKSIQINNQQAVVELTNGIIDKYDLNNSVLRAEYERKYGKLPVVTAPPTQPAVSVVINPPTAPEPPVPPNPEVNVNDESSTPEVSAANEVNRSNVREFEITDERAIMKLKNGTREEYNLTIPAERSKFENKYGRIIKVNAKTTEGVSLVTPRASIHNERPVTGVIAPASVKTTGVLAVDDNGYLITGEEDVVVTITSKATPDLLKLAIAEMKKKGITLKFDETKFENGRLVALSGSMSLNDSKSVFSASDFDSVRLAMINDEGRIYFKVNVADREVI